jgi:hypothetical protein
MKSLSQKPVCLGNRENRQLRSYEAALQNANNHKKQAAKKKPESEKL